jgi:dinuclear metal center YbgI/SA1388 family protein
MKVKELLETIENLYPKAAAESWDNVGLQVGNVESEISSIYISLDVTEDIIKDAISYGSNVILAHHPMIFSGIKQVTMDTELGRMISMLMKHNITLIVAHTNFDATIDGMNIHLANIIGLKNVSLMKSETDEFAIGVIGESPIENLNDFISHFKKEFQLDAVSYIGNELVVLDKIAIIGGSGSSFMKEVMSFNPSLFITGDVTYHRALEAKANGLNILNVGHHIEELGFRMIKDVLQKHLEKKVHIYLSTINTNPYKIK